MKNLLIAFVILGMATIGCQDSFNNEIKDPLNDSEAQAQLKGPGDDEEVHELTGEPMEDPEVNLDEIIDQIGTLERRGSAFHFSSVEQISKVAGLLSPLSEEQLDQWEGAMEFYSQRRLNNEKMRSEDVDDFEMEEQRINLRFIESLFDKEGVVYVDTMQIVYQGDKVFKAYSFNTGKEIKLAEQMKRSNTIPCNDCRPGKFQHCDKYFHNGNYKVVGTKWNEGYFFYASVGFRTKYYLKNYLGNWKMAYAPSMLGINLDQWHHVQICDGIWGTNNYSNIRKEKYNSPHHVEHVIKLGFFRQNYCVPYFGRVHHWKDGDYNNDAHCEPWNW